MSSPFIVPDVTAATLAAVRAALNGPGAVTDPGALALAKASTQGISTSTGLVGINLEAPAKSLFPVLSPLRNDWARKPAAVGATAVQWRAITAINAAKVKAGVAEKARNSVVTTTEVDKSQTYKDFGLDDFVTFTAQDAAVGFEDLRALGSANLLSAVMIEEEKIVLGGNVTAIAKPASVTAVSGTGGSLSNSTTYDFGVSALTLYGYNNGATGHGAADAPDETDARTGSQATGGGGTSLALTWPAVRGAVAYNVFAGTSGGTKFYIATVTANAYTLLALVGSGNVANTSDQTADSLSFDGLIPQAEVSGNGAYFKDLANATLTSDNAGGIVELDALLKSLFDTSRVGPTRIIVNSQEAQNIGSKITASGTTGGLRFTQVINPDGTITGGLVADSYRNKFAGPRLIPLMIHPYMAPGTLIAISERLPFPRTNVPNVFEIDVRREYTQYDWALVQRAWEYGIYGSECLKVYFPAGCGVITGIKNG